MTYFLCVKGFSLKVGYACDLVLFWKQSFWGVHKHHADQHKIKTPREGNGDTRNVDVFSNSFRMDFSHEPPETILMSHPWLFAS